MWQLPFFLIFSFEAQIKNEHLFQLAELLSIVSRWLLRLDIYGKKCSWKEGVTNSQGDGSYRILLPFLSLPSPTGLHRKEQFGQKLLNSCWDIVRKIQEIIKTLTRLTETWCKNLTMLMFTAFSPLTQLSKKKLLWDNLTETFVFTPFQISVKSLIDFLCLMSSPGKNNALN